MAVEGITLKNEIDREAQTIIKIVDSFAVLSRTREVLRDSKKDDKGKRQFTDLVEAAGQSCCIDEFKLYVQYKGSKEGSKKFWEKLAEPFNRKVDELIKSVANEIIARNPEIDAETVRLEVLKRFCGYMMWRMHVEMAKSPLQNQGRRSDNDL